MTATDLEYILAVDDTPASLRLVTDLLHSEGYSVRSAINGELALHAASAKTPQLILLDISMPDMDGYEVCRRLKADPGLSEVPVIFLTAMSDEQEILRGFDMGAVDYVTKPFKREELLARVRTHLELYRLRHHLGEEVDRRTYLLRESEKRLKNNLLESVSALAAMIELRDPYTAGHQRRVAKLAKVIADEMGLTEERIEGLELAAAVHDVGKISIPLEILSKQGPLGQFEVSLLREHPKAGYDILKSIDFPWPIANIVLQHHERINGSGYPDGLMGDETLLESRILAIADVIEAMASHRPYRPSIGIRKALGEVESKQGILFDSEIVAATLRLFREKGYQLEGWDNEEQRVPWAGFQAPASAEQKSE
jgi:putative two-component system response regulator